MCMYQGLFLLNTLFTSVKSLLKDLLNDYLPFKRQFDFWGRSRILMGGGGTKDYVCVHISQA